MYVLSIISPFGWLFKSMLPALLSKLGGTDDAAASARHSTRTDTTGAGAPHSERRKHAARGRPTVERQHGRSYNGVRAAAGSDEEVVYGLWHGHERLAEERRRG